MSNFDTLKRFLGSNLNRAILWLHARNHVESEEEIRNRAYFPRSRLRLTLKAGSKVGAVQDGFGMALRMWRWGSHGVFAQANFSKEDCDAGLAAFRKVAAELKA